ncbi:MAG: bifunctional 23S rRNA (guanine(2069)-N(7))-methyltransferase RlmK/23S rRNA (guanine(2445)-N(2))-methyltransferase RlmL [Gammaproteobacteria bacterium]
MSHEYFATAPKGTTELLAEELGALGAADLRVHVGGVSFTGDLALGYRACLWSRVANRILLVLARFPAADEAALYTGVAALDWSLHLRPTGTLAVDAVTTRSHLTHSQFLAQRTKDAVVDQLRDADGRRPGVDTRHPDVRLNLHLDRDRAQLALDLAGESLHRRGYRTAQGAAPLKENLAAAILLRARWGAIAARGGTLVDPMCGAGTFLVEAAMIAGDVAPGLLRGEFKGAGWLQFEIATWEALCAEARDRAAAGRARVPRIVGSDADPRMVALARRNVAQAGFEEFIKVVARDLLDATPPPDAPPGLLVSNPPYGERLGAGEDLAALYRTLGRRLREHFQGWEVALLLGDSRLGHALGIRAQRAHPLFNGALECTLLRLTVDPAHFAPDAPPGSARVLRAQQRIARRDSPSPGGAMFANRIRKNLQHLGRWARRQGVTCYRLYDADMPEYALAIDLYQADTLWVHVQEYAPPGTIDEAQARTRLDDALAGLPSLLDVPAEQIVYKRRQRQRGSAQYERIAEAGNFLEVAEQGLRFRVNLRDYLDTGLFLDHRLTRALVRARASGTDMLNLFAYTGSASVYAAAGGARSTLSIDMSATYCMWARQNLALNGFGLPKHEVVQADCLTWLAAPPDRRFGLVFLDPPSFSNSKRMEGTLDIQRDHARLIAQAATLLAPGGTLIFSTNLRRFVLDVTALGDYAIADRTRETLPEDFRRNPRIHQCYEITRRAAAPHR